MLLKTAFSNDGNWLCGWYKASTKYWWCIWDVRSAEEVQHQPRAKVWHQSIVSPHPPERSTSLLPMLIPFNAGRFVAMDAYRRLWFVRHGGPDQPETFSSGLDGSLAGAAVPSHDAVVLLRKVAGKNKLYVEVVEFAEGESNARISVRTLPQLDHDFEHGASDVAVVSSDEGTALMTCCADGYIRRRNFV